MLHRRLVAIARTVVGLAAICCFEHGRDLHLQALVWVKTGVTRAYLTYRYDAAAAGIL